MGSRSLLLPEEGFHSVQIFTGKGRTSAALLIRQSYGAKMKEAANSGGLLLIEQEIGHAADQRGHPCVPNGLKPVPARPRAHAPSRGNGRRTLGCKIKFYLDTDL